MGSLNANANTLSTSLLSSLSSATGFQQLTQTQSSVGRSAASIGTFPGHRASNSSTPSPGDSFGRKRTGVTVGADTLAANANVTLGHAGFPRSPSPMASLPMYSLTNARSTRTTSSVDTGTQDAEMEMETETEKSADVKKKTLLEHIRASTLNLSKQPRLQGGHLPSSAGRQVSPSAGGIGIGRYHPYARPSASSPSHNMDSSTSFLSHRMAMSAPTSSLRGSSARHGAPANSTLTSNTNSIASSPSLTVASTATSTAESSPDLPFLRVHAPPTSSSQPFPSCSSTFDNYSPADVGPGADYTSIPSFSATSLSASLFQAQGVQRLQSGETSIVGVPGSMSATTSMPLTFKHRRQLSGADTSSYPFGLDLAGNSSTATASNASGIQFMSSLSPSFSSGSSPFPSDPLSALGTLQMPGSSGVSAHQPEEFDESGGWCRGSLGLA
ncbi:hypothetical protein K474DRAFT_1386468 [Panus rudis PR-1116 ss-1]|nr:hypothetical protein K474DRAFT_1386468 [Panus rudis PR-1116 ss-1]